MSLLYKEGFAGSGGALFLCQKGCAKAGPSDIIKA